MDTNTLITVGVSVVTSGITAFGIISYRMGRYSEKIDQLEKCDLNTRLSKLEGQQLVRRKSPISLTDRGLQILNDSGGKKLINDNINELKELVEGKATIKTSYDVQEMSKRVIEGLTGDDRMNPIKDYAFKEGMELSDIVLVLGIYLRDKILELKNWKAEDIDQHEKQR